MAQPKLRVLIAKPGLDGHDRGAKVIARALRDAGMEVIYPGLRQTPEMVAEAALQEDVDDVGLSILSGAHMTLVPRVVDLLKQKGLDDVLVFVGGIIPDEDVAPLKALGVRGIFRPGANTTRVAGNARWFTRSMATRGSRGGLARATADAACALDAAGFDVILIETVGAGQSEVDIARTADTVLVVEAPGLGDEVQAIKAGILEIADVPVVKKADREGASNTVRALPAMLDMG